MKKLNVKLTGKQAGIIVCIAAAAAALLVYFFYFSPLLDTNDSSEQENVSMQTELDNLLKMKNEEDSYNSKTKDINDKIEGMLESLPSGIKAEDEILYAESLESGCGISVTNVGVDVPALVYSMEDGASSGSGTAASTAGTASADSSGTTESDAATASSGDGTVKGTVPTIGTTEDTEKTSYTGTLYETPLSVTFTANYDGFKKMLDSITSNSDIQSIESLSAAYDTGTGNITGTVVIDQYYLTDTDRAYNPPSITGVTSGTKNIFGSMEAPDVSDKANAS